MRGITSCYNEHAIKVSDLYCSSKPSNSNQPYLSPKLNPSIQDSVTCIYKLNSQSQKQVFITITWTKKLIGQGFNINITNSKFNSIAKQLKKNKGNEKFQFQNFEVKVLWDLSIAKYDEGPEPVNEFYVVVLVDSELVLQLGDLNEALLNTDEKFKVSNFSLVSRSERFSGTSVYATKVRFCETGKSHEILIKCGYEDEDKDKGLKSKSKSHVLCVCMDKKTVFEVKRLRWNFRGNQTLFVDGLVVDMMWDVHDWLFNTSSSASSSSCAVFLFRTRSGLDSRLWLEEKNLQKCKEMQEDKIGFSLLICACKNPD